MHLIPHLQPLLTTIASTRRPNIRAAVGRAMVAEQRRNNDAAAGIRMQACLQLYVRHRHHEQDLSWLQLQIISDEPKCLTRVGYLGRRALDYGLFNAQGRCSITKAYASASSTMVHGFQLCKTMQPKGDLGAVDGAARACRRSPVELNPLGPACTYVQRKAHYVRYRITLQCVRGCTVPLFKPVQTGLSTNLLHAGSCTSNSSSVTLQTFATWPVTLLPSLSGWLSRPCWCLLHVSVSLGSDADISRSPCCNL
jgi:hypothetical protein